LLEERKTDPNHNLVLVGSYPHDVSPYGIVDMAGNVREWTRDVVELTRSKGLRYVLGASWDIPLENADWRNMRDERNLDFGMGMRCVRD
jgi:formylglycine-generating enzyme required for sulfatase activity